MLRNLPIWLGLLAGCGGHGAAPKDPVPSNSPASRSADRVLESIEQLGAEIERVVEGARDAMTAADREMVRSRADALTTRCDELAREIDAQRQQTTEREVIDRLGALERALMAQKKALADARAAASEP